MIDQPSSDDAYIHQVRSAAYKGDLQAIETLLASRNDVNAVTDSGEPLLHEVLATLSNESDGRWSVIKTLLGRGVDPHALSSDNESSLTTPMWLMDARMISILLNAGVDPNQGCGFTETESFYDWAWFDYRLNVDLIGHPEAPEYSYDHAVALEQVREWALAHGKQPPDHLLLLREKGAMTDARSLSLWEGHLTRQSSGRRRAGRSRMA